MWFTSYFSLFLATGWFLLAVSGGLLTAYDAEAVNPEENSLSDTPKGLLIDLNNTSGENIVGGTSISIKDSPWQVAILRFGLLYCGGVLLTPNIVLTAQHCISAIAEGYLSLEVVAGVTNLDDFSEHRQQVGVQDAVQYPSYLSFELGKDLSLLSLRYPIRLDGIRTSSISRMTEKQERSGLLKPTALKNRVNPALWATTATVTGWGETLAEETTILQAVNVPIISNKDASMLYQQIITRDQLSAGAGGRDACFGDSGGPLTVPGDKPEQRLLVGLVSWGRGCALARYPGLYTRIPSFNSWINHMSPFASSPASFVALPIVSRYVVQAKIKTGRWVRKTINVPRGLRKLEIMIDGARSGDVDLYISAGEGNPVTKKLYSCASTQIGSSEGCLISFPISGIWNIGVLSFSQTLLPSISVNFYVINVQQVAFQTTGVLRNDERKNTLPFNVHPGTMFTANMTLAAGKADMFVYTQNLFRTKLTRTRCVERGILLVTNNKRTVTCNLLVPPSVTKAWVSIKGRSVGVASYKLKVDAVTFQPFEPYVQSEALNQILQDNKVRDFGPYHVQPGTELAISFRVMQGFAFLVLQFDHFFETNDTSKASTFNIPNSYCSLKGDGSSSLCSLIVPEGRENAFIRVYPNSDNPVFNLVVTYIKRT